MDDLRQLRQLRDDLRQLKAQYPELTTPHAQARLDAYLCTQVDDIGIHTETKEDYMPAKGQRMLGEDTSDPITIRVPISDLAFIDEHVKTLQQLHRYTRQGRSDAIRDLIQKGIDSIEQAQQQTVVPLGEPAPPRRDSTALDNALDAIERATGEPIPRARRQPMPPEAAELEDMPLEPPAVTQAPAKKSKTPVATKPTAKPKQPARAPRGR